MKWLISDSRLINSSGKVSYSNSIILQVKVETNCFYEFFSLLKLAVMYIRILRIQDFFSLVTIIIGCVLSSKRDIIIFLLQNISCSQITFPLSVIHTFSGIFAYMLTLKEAFHSILFVKWDKQYFYSARN